MEFKTLLIIMCRLTRNGILIIAFMFYGASLAAQNH